MHHHRAGDTTYEPQGPAIYIIDNPQVAAVFDECPPELRQKVLALRQLILRTAASTEGVGRLEETLKWNEPAYLTTETKSGSTVRIGWRGADPKQYALHFNCQTDLVERFRQWFPRELRFEGNRSIVFAEDDVVPVDSVATCIAAALRYHRDKRPRRR